MPKCHLTGLRGFSSLPGKMNRPSRSAGLIQFSPGSPGSHHRPPRPSRSCTAPCLMPLATLYTGNSHDRRWHMSPIVRLLMPEMLSAVPDGGSPSLPLIRNRLAHLVRSAHPPGYPNLCDQQNPLQTVTSRPLASGTTRYLCLILSLFNRSGHLSGRDRSAFGKRHAHTRVLSRI